MIGTRQTGNVERVVMSIDGNELLSVTVDGKPARLAVIDAEGQVVAQGDDVAREVEAVAVESYRNFLAGKGWLRVKSR